jgi:hypothetical protein
MSGGHAPGRHTPSAVFKKKGGFRLYTGKAKLAGVAWNAPRGLVLAQSAQTLRNGSIVKLFDRWKGLSQDGLEPLRTYELHSSGAVFADASDEPEGVPGRDMEFSRPLVEHGFVVKCPQR